MSFNMKFGDFLNSFTCCIKCSAEPTISFDCNIGYFSNIWRRILRTSLSRSWDATRRVSFLFSLSIIDEVELSFANTYLTKVIISIIVCISYRWNLKRHSNNNNQRIDNVEHTFFSLPRASFNRFNSWVKATISSGSTTCDSADPSELIDKMLTVRNLF